MPLPVILPTGALALLTVETLAKTIYGEARGESYKGQLAVGWVIRNRAADGKLRWPRDIIGVCRQPKQFSCWNEDDKNFSLIKDAHINSPGFLACVGAAALVLSGSEPDPTGGATHYHTEAVKPGWAAKMKESTRIGSHIFYVG